MRKTDLQFIGLVVLILAAGAALWLLTDMAFPWVTFGVLIGVIIVCAVWYWTERSRTPRSKDCPDTRS